MVSPRVPLRHLLMIAAALALLAAGAWWYTSSREPVDGPLVPGTASEDAPNPFDGFPDTREECEAAGDTWNECASACPPDAEACIQVCVPRCESAGSDTFSETVRLYFLHDKLDPEQTCEKVFPVDRKILTGPTLEFDVMEELLAGPTDEERAAGYSSAIPEGTTFLGYDLEGNAARFTFDPKLDRGVAGSCRVGAIRSQIEATVKASGLAPEGYAIDIAVEGKTPEETLQP